MFKPFAAAALLAATLLTGCNAAMPGVPAAPAAAKPLAQHAQLSDTKFRQLLGVSGTALWGVQYSGSYYENQHRDQYDRWVTDRYLSTSGVLSGDGELIKASKDRFVYTVPDGQVLVLNQIAGGDVTINGFTYHASQPGMHYVFGPGEMVVLQFAMIQTNYSYSQTTASWSYAPISISGYTADPSLIGGQAGVRVK